MEHLIAILVVIVAATLAVRLLPAPGEEPDEPLRR